MFILDNSPAEFYINGCLGLLDWHRAVLQTIKLGLMKKNGFIRHSNGFNQNNSTTVPRHFLLVRKHKNIKCAYLNYARIKRIQGGASVVEGGSLFTYSLK